ncbi:MAG TPA: hypothetical protein VFW30_00185 [Bryocella sp.]|nr:hypothetical protein [Bryocella sp.]
MTHRDIDNGTLRSFIDGAVTSDQAKSISDHLTECVACRATLQNLQRREEAVRSALNELPVSPGTLNEVAHGWAAFERRREEASDLSRYWTVAKGWWVATGAMCAAALILLPLGPGRIWAQEFLAIFRVEHFTVLEVNPEVGASLQNNQMLNQTVSRMLSDNLRVIQRPDAPQALSDEAAATQAAGFDVKFLGDMTPTKILLESGADAEFTLNRSRLQAILDESGRTDLQIPASVDGAVVNFRIAPGVVTTYDQCANRTPPPIQGACITVMQVPSPVVMAPQGFDPAQLVQVGLQFLGMSASEAASFTQTVDWTSTFVLPVDPGTMTYRQVSINGIQGVLLRHTGKSISDRYIVTWVQDAIVYVVESHGDDDAAVELAEQLT